MNNYTENAEKMNNYAEQSQKYVSLEELWSGPLQSTQTLPYFVQAIGELNISQLRMGMVRLLMLRKEPPKEDIGSLPLGWFDPDVSCCLIEDGRVYGLLLVHRLENGNLRIELMQIESHATKKDLLYLMRYALAAAVDKYGGDVLVQFDMTNALTRNILERVLI